MSWRTDLVARLRSDPALAAQFGTRIAFFEAARSWATYPQLVLQEISPGREYTHDGPDDLDRPRVQFDIYAQPGTSLELAEAALLAEMETVLTDQGSTRFHIGFLEGRSMPDPGDVANQDRILRLSMDFSFYFQPI
jgi:hypothetical protein